MWEIIIALISLIGGAAISQVQQDNQNARTAHEALVRSWFDAIKNRFNLSIDQLNQAANKLDIDLERLTSAARGSARLAKASKIYREYVQKYPDKVQKINDVKNTIQKAANNLSAKQEQVSSQIVKGKKFNKLDIANSVQDEINKVNSAIGDLNNNITDNSRTDEQPNDAVNVIDTTLQPVPEDNRYSERMEKGDAFSPPKKKNSLGVWETHIS